MAMCVEAFGELLCLNDVRPDAAVEVLVGVAHQQCREVRGQDRQSVQDHRSVDQVGDGPPGKGFSGE